jgi:glycosyltransferase involved in cell wall biosynthesis
LRILQISSAKELGGGERHLADLANELTTRGHRVFAALRPRSPLISELRNLPRENTFELPLRNALDAGNASRLASLVKKHEIEIVHAHMARDYPLAAYAARRNPKARLIITRHVLFPISRLHRITLARVARVIAVSEAVRRQFIAAKLVPPEKVILVHNGIDISRFQKSMTAFDRSKFCHNWRIPEESVLVGSVGAITPLKGHEDFLRAAVYVRRMVPRSHFIIAGVDGSAGQKIRAELEKLVHKLDLSGRVTFIGRLDDITELYNALTVFVSASHTESFGLAIVEAMAAGVSVVATKTEGAQEIIKHGQTGLLVPVSDTNALAGSIIGLLNEKELRENLARSARASVSTRFSLQQMVDETVKIYSAVLGI